jgi:20S proteasome subunit alpha 6|uniref:Proteasome subunit alpha type n=1 Tax=Eutreptiella gymnastica TaxID=73025 RepID=A0A7S4GK14_9EUGL|mmetsp:Transcript_34863/g.58261  ORF Transcript_34863/g.58261 Transcript_34863/m.58261 type:complete len:261 (+) Transcript_34863:27-809(+)
MFRNQYDNDITTWSPQGRLHQVEYAMEAVKQGSATVGAKCKTHTVLVALKRAPQAELSSHQPKTFKLDKHMGMTIAGLTPDARVLARYMRTECMNHRYVFNSAIPVSRLVTRVADKSQRSTQVASKRPFGVGLLVAGYDQLGPCLYETCPSGQFYNYKAMAIGARAQSAKTYLEKNFEKFENCTVDELVVHCLKALESTCAEGVELSQANTTVAVVGKDTDFTTYDDDDATRWLDLLQKAKDEAAPAPAEPASESSPMEE